MELDAWNHHMHPFHISIPRPPEVRTHAALPLSLSLSLSHSLSNPKKPRSHLGGRGKHVRSGEFGRARVHLGCTVRTDGRTGDTGTGCFCGICKER